MPQCFLVQFSSHRVDMFFQVDAANKKKQSPTHGMISLVTRARTLNDRHNQPRPSTLPPNPNIVI